ncbi:MAG: hypothetical protein AAF081_12530, partial [Actinomycetota bacterium]
MNVLSGTGRHVPTVMAYRVRRAIDEFAMLGLATFGALVISTFALSSPYAEFSVAATLYMFGVAVILATPRMGVYLLIFLAFVGEPDTMPWYPFNKNGSSAESWLFVDDRLFVSPFEGYIGVTLIALLLHHLRHGGALRVWTPYTIPALVFAGAIVIGLGWGVLTGGELSIAINQTRSMLLVPVIYLLLINLLDRTTVRTALWVMIWAITIKCCFALYAFFFTFDQVEQRQTLDLGTSPVTHSAAVQMNVVLFVLIAVTLFKGSPLAARLAMPFLVLPVGLIYVIAERRAAVGGLVVACVLMFYVLARRLPDRPEAIG